MDSLNSSAGKWDCPICLQLLHQPVTLTCGHNFCVGCLSGVLERSVCYGSGGAVRCPTCRKATRYEGDGRFPLRVNGALNDAICQLHPEKVAALRREQELSWAQLRYRLLFRPTVGEPFILTCKGDDRLSELKVIVADHIGVPVEEIALSLQGRSARLEESLLAAESLLPMVGCLSVATYESVADLTNWAGPAYVAMGVAVALKARPRLFLMQSHLPADASHIPADAEEYRSIDRRTRREITIVDFTSDMTVTQLREVIDQDISPLRVSALLYAGKSLQAGKALRDYGIVRENCVHLITKRGE